MKFYGEENKHLLINATDPHCKDTNNLLSNVYYYR